MKRALAIALFLASSMACSSTQPRTEVIVRVLADPAVARETARLHLTVQAGPNRSEDSLAIRSERDLPDVGTLTFPYEIALVPADGDAARVFEVTVSAQRGDATHSHVGTARVVSGYVQGHTLVVPLRLEDACLGVPACEPGNTCHLAACVDAFVDPSSLGAYFELDGGVDPGVDTGMDSGSTTLVDTGVDARVDADLPDLGTDAWRSTDATLDTAMDGAGAAPARLLAPISGSNVTTRRPLLRWTGASATATLEICADHACETVIESQSASTSSAQPISDLPLGASFWRIVDGAITSYTWELWVGAETGHDGWSGITFDADADGFADLAVGADASHTVRVFYGSASGLVMPARTTLTDSHVGFGTSVAAGGDSNGDGYGELLVRSPGTSLFGLDAIDIHAGGPSGVQTPSAWSIGVGDASSMWGIALAYAGNLDGDGYGDFVGGGPGDTMGTGFIYISFGAPAYFGSRTLRIPGPGMGALFGTALAGVGDVTGDRLDDLVVGAPGTSGGAGSVYLCAGATDAAIVSGMPLTSAGYPAFGTSLAAGDLNGDGLTDIAIGAPGNATTRGSALTAYGNGTGLVLGTHFDGPIGESFGATVAIIDENCDGIGDLLVGQSGYTSGAGRAVIFDGVLGGDPAAPTVIMGFPAGAQFGASLVQIGDTDGAADGNACQDFAIGAWGDASGAGAVYPFSAATGSGAVVHPAIVGPDAAGHFGRSLARAFGICTPDGRAG